MKRNFAIGIGIFTVLSASAVFANPEQGSKAETRTTQILALESRLHAAPDSSAEHVVNPGDNMEKIARLHGCRVSDLLNANGLKADSIIHPGQKLKLPATDHTPPPAAAPSALPAIATHTVAPGETFAAIARQHGIPLNNLLAANPEIKPTALRPGQTVRLGQTSAPAKTRSLDAGNTQMILASKNESPSAAESPSPAPLGSPPTVKIQQIKIDREMTYQEFASRQGTNTRRLNQLNGLDLLDSALLAKGSELLAPAQP
jgi:LysM repeat protein